ncbi:unnamed protein product [Rotaria magnacalcarata]|uniref:BTB domain-containing protein n=1 Tax=Rotaria magnacalcarata TaxID=392030 RepID=A0A814TEA6_9BILA|nr:unnamed protein product [Rotaria magnacalcarata]CAF4596053.1 unnamed protein product [Rotaria magnacalcarata]
MSASDDSDSSSNFDDADDSSDDGNNPTVLVAQEQWVKLIEFCSFKSKSDESVSKGVGIEKLCGATDTDFGDQEKVENGWIVTNNNNQGESFSVSFQARVFINEIYIYESLNPGSIVQLEMLETQQNKWWTMWQRKTSPEIQPVAHNIFKPILRRYHIQSNTIRVTLNPRYTDRIGIQAIKIAGSNIFDANLNHRSLFQSMEKLYEQALSNTNTDIQFIFDDKTVNAHRNILCCRSSYFRSLLLSDFLEKSQRKPIQLTDIDYETFLEILHFVYTGTYHQSISFDIAIKAMIYSNKINLLTAKNASIEHICRYLRLHHDYIINIYSLVKKMSPAFDLLLDYVYELCSEFLNDICKNEDFINLEKESMIDLICQGAQRRDAREQEKLKQMASYHENARNEEEEEE